MIRFILVVAVPLIAFQPEVGLAQPKAAISENSFQFGRVVRGTPVQHEFVIENRGNAPLVIARVAMTAPLTVQRLPRIEPGQRGSIPVKLDTSALKGPFDGQVILFCNDPLNPEIPASFAGEVFETVELSPLPAFFIATTRNRAKEQSIEIINHEPQPLRILRVEHAPGSVTTRLDTVQDGQRYRLTALMPGTGPGGKHTERIIVHTSSAVQPRIPVAANVWLRERVYAFPDEVDMGAVPFQTVSRNPDLLGRLTQTVMVYQAGGKGFEVKARTDIQGISVAAERGPQGDRWQLTIALRKDAQPGLMKGSILIETNDPEFKTLTIPIRGALLTN